MKLNKALYEIGDILESIGVKELLLTHDHRNVLLDTNPENIDTDLLSRFCQDIDHFHSCRFGQNGNKHAA